MHIDRTTWRLTAPVLLAAALAAPIVGCSSNSGNSSAPAVNEQILGTPNKATGTPVTFGFISDGKATDVDTTDEINGANAAAAYANDYLGGIGGHPIQVKVCQTLTQPSAATDCANQMVAANVAAVVEGANGEVDQTIPPLTAAKIPLLTHTAGTMTSLETPGVFVYTNGMSYFGTPAVQAKADGIKKADMVTIAIPAAEGPARAVGALFYGNAGIALTVTAIPPGTADMTPQITAADADRPGLYHVIGDPTFCTSALKAIRTVDPNAKIAIIDRCISPGSGKAIPNGYQGIDVVTFSDLNKDAPDAQLFDTVLGKYGNGAQFGSTAAFGYSAMLATINALDAAKVTDVTPATVLAGIRSAPALEYPLSGGMQFQCTGKQIAMSPNICSADGIVATANQDGSLSDYQRIPADPQLYAMPGR